MVSPSVSVILPTFNRLPYLREALASVRAQTWPDWEVVIADDGSDEETRAFLRAATGESPRIRVVWRARSGNPAAARNAAVREAAGEYLAFLDSDDLWLPRKLERQLRRLAEQPACQWSYTAFIRVHASGQVLDEERTRRWTPHDGTIFEQLVTGEASVRTPSVLAARRLVLEAGGFDESLRFCEDYDLWMRMALLSRVAVVDEPLVHVRLHGEGHTRDWAGAYHGRDQSLRKLQGVAPAVWRALLARERARNAARLMAEHAARGERGQVLASLLHSLPHAWAYPEWWRRALGATARSYWPTTRRPAAKSS